MAQPVVAGHFPQLQGPAFSKNCPTTLANTDPNNKPISCRLMGGFVGERAGKRPRASDEPSRNNQPPERPRSPSSQWGSPTRQVLGYSAIWFGHCSITRLAVAWFGHPASRADRSLSPSRPRAPAACVCQRFTQDSATPPFARRHSPAQSSGPTSHPAARSRPGAARSSPVALHHQRWANHRGHPADLDHVGQRGGGWSPGRIGD